MSKVTHTTTCRVAELAHEASAVITTLDTCSIAEIEKLFELEKAASAHVARSPVGALFQIGIIHAHADTILSHVPSDSPALSYCEEIFGEMQRMLHSIAGLLRSADTEGVLNMYYLSVSDPFVAN